MRVVHDRYGPLEMLQPHFALPDDGGTMRTLGALEGEDAMVLSPAGWRAR